jgi:hypothetical protein
VTITLRSRGVGGAVLAGLLGAGAIATAVASRGDTAEDLALRGAAQHRADLWAQLLEQAAARDIPASLMWSGLIDAKSPSVRWMLRTSERNFRDAIVPGTLQLDLLVQKVQRQDDGRVRATAVLDTTVRLYGQTVDSGGSEGRVLTFVAGDSGRLELVSDVSDGTGVLGWWEDEPPKPTPKKAA